MNQKYLVIIDVDKIQDFIFRNVKLKPIFGSSFLVSHLTSHAYCRTKRVLNHLTKKQKLIDLTAGNDKYIPLFFDGGVIKIIFSKKEDAIRFVEDMQREFINNAPAATFSHVIHEFSDFSHSILENAEKMLARIKKSKMYTIMPNTNPIFELCQWCRTYPANFKIQLSTNESELLCEQCNASFDAYKDFVSTDSDVPLKVFHKEFKEKFKCDFKSEFDEIKDKRSYLAVVKMDADDLGDKLIELTRDKKEDNCVESIRVFSQKLNSEVLSLLFNSFDNIFNDDEIKKGELPLRPIIIGGDDICFVMAGDMAIRFVLNFVEKLNHNTFLKLHAITFSIGICFVKAHYPFTLAHKLAEELLKNAKSEKPRRRDDIWHTIDWEVLHSSSFEDLSSIRRTGYTISQGVNEFILTYKPYIFKNGDPRDFVSFLKNAKCLKGILKGSKFKGLRKIVRENYAVSDFEFKKITSKLSKQDMGEIKNILKGFGMENDSIWSIKNGKAYNNFLDMVELSDFIGDV